MKSILDFMALSHFLESTSDIGSILLLGSSSMNNSSFLAFMRSPYYIGA
jgi:hypothetical protein